MNKKMLLLGFSSFCLFVVLWQGFSLVFKQYVLLFPSPLGVFQVFKNSYFELLHHMMATFYEMLLGFLLAIFLAFPLAVLMHRFSLIKLFMQPFFVMMQCIPMFALAPVFVLFFGFSLWVVVFPMAIMMSFPLTLAIYRGLEASCKELDSYFSLHGARFLQRLFAIKIPSAKGYIFSGLRVSSALSGISAIGGEWIAAQKGLGVYMQIARRNFDLEGISAGVLCLLFLSLSFYLVIAFFEKVFETQRINEKKVSC